MPEPSAVMMNVTAVAAKAPAMAALHEKGVRLPSAAVGTSMMVVSVIGVSVACEPSEQSGGLASSGSL
jgi:hypothetical protein